MAKLYGEKLVAHILDEFGIKYETEKTFEDCKSIRKLRFDFYLPQYNCCIEYDGEHHYGHVNFSGFMSRDQMQENLEKVKKHDKIKNEYCKTNNIELFRVNKKKTVKRLKYFLKGLIMKDVQVYYKKLHEDAKLPFYSTEYAIGMDMVTVSDAIIHDKYIEYKFGFAMELPAGYGGFLFPRSSISKSDFNLCNAVGIIDPDYRGEVTARFNLNLPIHNIARYDEEFVLLEPNEGYTKNKILYLDEELEVFEKGDKILQLVVMPVPRCKNSWKEELPETVRGDGGYGHTGR
tara:strand:+ start:6114 stop:6983 length:870 start_codon:yes stop_codon:yes gene_type:complete